MALCAAAVLPKAWGQTTVEDLSGRWASQRHGYTLDVTRCGAEWCGVKLKDDKSCGAVVLRLERRVVEANRPPFEGTLTLDPAARTYQVYATPSLAGAAGAPEIFLLGYIGRPNPLSRTIPFQDTLVRGGDAVCRAENKVSDLARMYR